MRTKAAGGAERRPLQPRTEAAVAAAAPAGQGTWRSPLLGRSGARELGAAAAIRQYPRLAGPSGSAPPPTGSVQGSAPPDAPRWDAGSESWPPVARTSWGSEARATGDAVEAQGEPPGCRVQPQWSFPPSLP